MSLTHQERAPQPRASPSWPNAVETARLALTVPVAVQKPSCARKELSTLFWLHFCCNFLNMARVTVETFRQEIADAMRMYDKYVICIDKTLDEFEAALVS